jgi:hypothetical protein
MGSNKFGSNPSNGANYHTRNGITRSEHKFKTAIQPHGSLLFLICEGNMRGALHDGKTCGGVAHFPLFAPNTDFSPLYALLDGADDVDEEPVEEPTTTP